MLTSINAIVYDCQMRALNIFQRADILKRHAGRCYYCKTRLIWGERYSAYTPQYFNVDHKLPKSRGGTNELDNVVASCRACNMSKGTKDWPSRVPIQLEIFTNTEPRR